MPVRDWSVRAFSQDFITGAYALCRVKRAALVWVQAVQKQLYHNKNDNVQQVFDSNKRLHTEISATVLVIDAPSVSWRSK